MHWVNLFKTTETRAQSVFIGSYTYPVIIHI